MKKLKVSKTLISAIAIILSVLSIFNVINSRNAMSIVFTLLGIVSILDGYSSYIRNKKGEATFLFLSGSFIIFVSVFTKFF
ncbi:MAG: hypothetical protein ACREV6_15945 [Clostridium sp.]|uniref:hypothetical protein n=1 Tax=Clostridium sp. TaxID=1506 RepID=UPI003D6D2685